MALAHLETCGCAWSARHDAYRDELGELARSEGVADRVEFAGPWRPRRSFGDPRGERGAGADPAGLPLLPDEPAEQAVRVRGGGPAGAGQRPARDRRADQRAPDRPGRRAGRWEDVAAKLGEMLEPERNGAFRTPPARRRASCAGKASRSCWPRPTRRYARRRAMATAIEQVRARAQDSATLSRTFSRGRWHEYGSFLRSAREHGYRIVSLEDWVGEGPAGGGRPDADTAPRRRPAPALGPARWRRSRRSWACGPRGTSAGGRRTPIVIGSCEIGFEVGLHYETLTRNALERGLTGRRARS